MLKRFAVLVSLAVVTLPGLAQSNTPQFEIFGGLLAQVVVLISGFPGWQACAFLAITSAPTTSVRP